MALNEDENVLDLHLSVLLRGLVPYRRLSYQEALFYAEQQASVFLKLVHIHEPPVPVEQLVQDVGLAAVVKDDPAQAAPGQSQLDQITGEWVISLNPESDAAGRGFVIAHEVKHILDEGFGETLYRPVDVMTPAQRKEYVADYFAACLLMPRPWLERYWRQGVRDIKAIADRFGTSPACVRLRLEALELLA